MVERRAVSGSYREDVLVVQAQAEDKVYGILWIKPFVAVAGIKLGVQFDHELKNSTDWERRACAVNELMPYIDVELLRSVPGASHQVHQEVPVDPGPLLHPLRDQNAEAALEQTR